MSQEYEIEEPQKDLEHESRASYGDIRKEVHHEHSLLNQRVGWLVT